MKFPTNYFWIRGKFFWIRGQKSINHAGLRGLLYYIFYVASNWTLKFLSGFFRVRGKFFLFCVYQKNWDRQAILPGTRVSAEKIKAACSNLLIIRGWKALRETQRKNANYQRPFCVPVGNAPTGCRLNMLDKANCIEDTMMPQRKKAN